MKWYVVELYLCGGACYTFAIETASSADALRCALARLEQTSEEIALDSAVVSDPMETQDQASDFMRQLQPRFISPELDTGFFPSVQSEFNGGCG